MSKRKITFNESESLNRISWSSMQSTGLWDAYKHKQVFGGLKKNYYIKEKK